jgi:methylisocitrate lyase
MTYLVAAWRPSVPAGQAFRDLLARPQILRMPGVYNGLSALQAKAAGFEALYLSGAAVSAAMGLPDLGVTTIDDLCFHIRQCRHASGLPILADGDTGFGEALNVMNMVVRFEEAGAGAVQIEDQILPKKCGHLNDKKLAGAHEMAAKVAAAARARRDLVIVARTDALAKEGLDAAVDRARLYLEAGADAIFPEALTEPEMFRAFAERVKAPLLANMTEFGATPFLTAAEFEALGYRMVIWPVSALRVAAKAQGELYDTIARTGAAAAMLDRMQTRAELYATLDYAAYEALDQTLVKTVLP